jgi:hypothetical protein
MFRALLREEMLLTVALALLESFWGDATNDVINPNSSWSALWDVASPKENGQVQLWHWQSQCRKLRQCKCIFSKWQIMFHFIFLLLLLCIDTGLQRLKTKQKKVNQPKHWSQCMKHVMLMYWVRKELLSRINQIYYFVKHMNITTMYS